MSNHESLNSSFALSRLVDERLNIKGLVMIFIIATAFGVISNLSSAMLASEPIKSYGTIEYSDARKIHADGRWLRDKAGNIVRLVGYAGGIQTMAHTPVGLWERNGDTQHYDWTFDAEAIRQNLDAMKISGANLIRSHFALDFLKYDQIMVDPNSGQTITYKQNFHEMIRIAADKGIYVIVDGMSVTHLSKQDALPYPPYQDGEPNQTLAREIIPNKEAFIDLWLELALFLKDLPNVIFEPWNEPHAPVGYDSLLLRDEWFTVIRDLTARFRENGIDHPIVVQWGYACAINWDFPDGMPEAKMSWVLDANRTIADPIQNIIFSTHLYRTGGAFGIFSLGQARQEYEDVKEAMELELIYNVSQEYPILIGEIGASYYTNREDETLALKNALQVLNEWEISWAVYWWRLELEWGIFRNDVWTLQPEPAFNENGIVVMDAMRALG